ncbi:MAG: hypothetical protein QME55_03980 [Brevundimonas sp.]|uniref:hypothetical protein n=1 Tax=Brevundimonas sp. TaxID=1871086 RepID=UPI00261A6839|nr:hypothetical protein [Brevundimonas sp.]MDI6623866.1 hypothetical protein [Brevundimonas sp.]MDQ7811094.1 hypothetical protein [Brevundimonas sp.]
MIQAILFAAALQTAPAPAPPPAIDCADADHSAFNFWIGDWDVSATGTETVVARSVISSTAGGCAIEEDYRQTVGPGGVATTYHGVSFSAFDARRGGVWRQFYMDSGGSVTVFEGGLRGDAMVLEAPGRGGGVQRMTVSPQADGSVRQRGESTTDGGASWTPGYDFTYRRR